MTAQEETANILLTMMDAARLNCWRFTFAPGTSTEESKTLDVFSSPTTGTGGISEVDRGFRRHLYPEDPQPYNELKEWICDLGDDTASSVTDPFDCHFYVLKKTEEAGNSSCIMVGPFLAVPMTDEYLLDLMMRLQLPMARFDEIRNYYRQFPVFSLEAIQPVLGLLADSFFGSQSYRNVMSVHRTPRLYLPSESSNYSHGLDPDRLRHRYDLENAFLEQIRLGNTRKALAAYRIFSKAARGNVGGLQPRLSNRLRDRKDLQITLNTICRKAAEQAQVHPWYIDNLSNRIIPLIEQEETDTAANRSFEIIIERYCSLVREYSLKDYSPLLQTAIDYINRNLASSLTLQGLSEICSVTPSYLSARFRKETGYPPIEYINRRRVRQAGYLLVTTPLPVRVIAGQVGFSDYNYFSRVFRKITGIAPSGYRRNTVDGSLS